MKEKKTDTEEIKYNDKDAEGNLKKPQKHYEKQPYDKNKKYHNKHEPEENADSDGFVEVDSKKKKNENTKGGFKNYDNNYNYKQNYYKNPNKKNYYNNKPYERKNKDPKDEEKTTTNTSDPQGQDKTEKLNEIGTKGYIKPEETPVVATAETKEVLPVQEDKSEDNTKKPSEKPITLGAEANSKDKEKNNREFKEVNQKQTKNAKGSQNNEQFKHKKIDLTTKETKEHPKEHPKEHQKEHPKEHPKEQPKESKTTTTTKVETKKGAPPKSLKDMLG